MPEMIFVFIGGGLGVLSRYAVFELSIKYHSSGFPVGTFMINLIGSFVIGLLWGIFQAKDIAPGLRIAIFVGFLGGFTTFSSFMLESMKLIKDKKVLVAILYIILSNIMGLVLVFGGYLLSQAIMGKLIK